MRALLPTTLTLLLAVAGLSSGPARAQESAPKTPPPPAAPPSAEPGEPGAAPRAPLSERLEEQEGVLKPPPTGDKEIKRPIPEDFKSRMPVIPPPGAPGDKVQPK